MYMCTLKQPNPAGSSMSLSNPRAHLPTLPSTWDISPGMLLRLWILGVLELILALAINVFLLWVAPTTASTKEAILIWQRKVTKIQQAMATYHLEKIHNNPAILPLRLSLYASLKKKKKIKFAVFTLTRLLTEWQNSNLSQTKLSHFHSNTLSHLLSMMLY